MDGLNSAANSDSRPHIAPKASRKQHVPRCDSGFCSSGADAEAGDRRSARPGEGSLASGKILAGLGLGKPQISDAGARAARNATRLEEELFASGDLCPALYFEAMAETLGLPFLATIDSAQVVDVPGAEVLLKSAFGPLRLARNKGETVTVFSPRAADLERIAILLKARPDLARTLAVATPKTVRAAVWEAGASARVAQCVRQLAERQKSDSASMVTNGTQGFMLGVLVSGMAAIWFSFAHFGHLALHLLLSWLFGACVFIRALAALDWRLQPCRKTKEPDEAGLPIYTIMVALYDEAAVVAQLVDALDAIRWPLSRLDIKLVCEADDAATITALESLNLRPHYEIVRVPRVKPFTKPKALCYAMAGVKGDYVVVYDAEDRPDRDQLLEAYSVFAAERENVSCIQAPLIIANTGHSWLTGLFALEYAALFRGMLPFLARQGLPIPLGGTSNHIRGLM